jgi:hypothetical protein
VQIQSTPTCSYEPISELHLTLPGSTLPPLITLAVEPDQNLTGSDQTVRCQIRQIRFFRHCQVSSLLVYYGGAANPARFLIFDFPSISGIYSNLTVQVQGKVKWPRTSAFRSAENCQINIREVYWPRLDNTDVRPLLRFFELARTKNIQPLIPPIKTGSRSYRPNSPNGASEDVNSCLASIYGRYCET